MLLGKKTRYFVRYSLGLKAARSNGAPLPFFSADAESALNVISEAVAAGTAAFAIKDNDVVRITKVEVREQDDVAILLVRRRDEDAATQVFEQAGTGVLWEPPLDPGQAPAVSSHVFVRLSDQGAPPTHRVIVEEVPGLGRTYIQYALHQVLKALEYGFRDRRGREGITYTIPTLGGVASRTLGEALVGGGIKFIELVAPADTDGLDMDGLAPHPMRMRLSVKPDANPLNLLERVRAWAAARDWPNVRVQVETADDRTKVVEIAREADAADVLLVKSEVVATRNVIAVCTDEINDELAAMAVARLQNDADW